MERNGDAALIKNNREDGLRLAYRELITSITGLKVSWVLGVKCTRYFFSLSIRISFKNSVACGRSVLPEGNLFTLRI